MALSRGSRPCCLVVIALLFGVFASTGTLACGGSVQTSALPSAHGPLVLFARPQFIASAHLGEIPASSGPIRVDMRAYSSGEDVLLDLVAGKHADVMEVPTNETAERLVREGLLRPLDTDRISEWSRLYPVLKDLPGVMSDGRVYVVPITAAVTGMLYDPVAATRPDSFSDLFDSRYEGRVAFADDAALAFQVAALGFGLPDPANLGEDQALTAEIHLKRFRKSFTSFWCDLDDLANAFENGKVAVATGDRRDALVLSRRGVRVNYVLPVHGQVLASYGLAITSTARDIDAAYALIDRFLDPTMQARIAARSGDLVSNREAMRYLTPAERARLGLADLERLDRPIARLPSLEHLDWIQAWYEVKKGRG